MVIEPFALFDHEIKRMRIIVFTIRLYVPQNIQFLVV